MKTCQPRTIIAIRVFAFLREKANRDKYNAKILPLVRKKRGELKKLCGW